MRLRAVPTEEALAKRYGEPRDIKCVRRRGVLRAVLDPAEAGDFLIRIQHSEWVDDYLRGDYNLNRFGSFLDRDDLALATARKLFGETFLGT
jgi:type VI secretion system protein ImpM